MLKATHTVLHLGSQNFYTGSCHTISSQLSMMGTCHPIFTYAHWFPLEFSSAGTGTLWWIENFTPSVHNDLTPPPQSKYPANWYFGIKSSYSNKIMVRFCEMGWTENFQHLLPWTFSIRNKDSLGTADDFYWFCGSISVAVQNENYQWWLCLRQDENDGQMAQVCINDTLFSNCSVTTVGPT